jgi:hypothetical protein
MDFARTGKICSFCAKPGGPDTKLAGGLGAMICDDCVETFHKNNQSPERLPAMSTPPWEHMTDAELLATLPLIMKAAEQNAAFAQEWVDMLRDRKISWSEVGKALGVSRQAVWERYAHRPSDKTVSA